MNKRTLFPEENHGFYKNRDYYKGKSFHWAGDWKEKEHYFNDEYVTDFINCDGVMLACKKSHISTVNNKPKFITDVDETGGYKYSLESNEFWEVASYKATGYFRQYSEQPIHYGNDEPESKEALWITKQNGIDYGNSDPIIQNIYSQLGWMQEQLETCMRIIRYGINAGDATVGGRTIMMQTSDIAINPITGDEEPTDADKPDEFEYTVPNIAIKRDKASKFKNNLNNLINGELIWIEAEDSTSVDPGLHIWLNGAFVSIGSGSGIIDDENMTEKQLKEMMSSIYFDDLGLTDGYGNNYSVKINGDGNIIVYNDDNPYLNKDGSLNLGTRNTNTGGSYISDFLRIQSVFLGGNLTPDILPAATHSFVELGNADSKDINLNGLVLLYRSGSGVPWTPLYLKGIIPSGKTFLIRGKQCGKPSNICVNVDSYDMEWRNSNGELIGFNENGATFYLTVLDSEGKIYDREVQDWVEIKDFTSKTPYNGNDSDPKGYIDLVGIGKNEFAEGNAIDAEKNLIIKSIFFRKNAMDPGSKTVIKEWAKRSTTAFWDYCKMDKNQETFEFPYYSSNFKSKLAPKSSYNGKGFYDKRTSFSLTEPNCVNVTFGRQATDNGSGDAVRCFNWVSYGYYDEAIQYKLVNSDTWTNTVYSISENNYEDDPSVNAYRDLYKRRCWVTGAGHTMTTHKVIVRNLSAGDYLYRVVRFDENNNVVYSSPEHRFFVTLTTNEPFKFVQVTDQQGFNYEEYTAWTKSAYGLLNDTDTESFEFTINTGDMTQSGSRESEWVDYFNGRKPLQDFVEMPCIGNNDLCALNLFKLDKGGGTDKLNSESIWLFYTFDLNESNSPIFKYIHSGELDESKYTRLVLDKGLTEDGKSWFTYFMPSIYSFVYNNYQFIALNSEFMTNESQEIYHPDLSAEADITLFRANAYYNEYKWLEQEHTKDKQTIVYCHEIPVCIIAAQDEIESGATSSVRKIGNTSKLNTDLSYGVETTEWIDDKKKYENGFSFTEYFQNNKIKLCIGGHKHTYSLTYPVKENITYDNGNRTVEPQNMQIFGKTSDEGIDYDLINENENHTVYIMCQATGYKLTSNKDIPQENTPWMYKYFACKRKESTNNDGQKVQSAVVNPGQQYPMYNIFVCSSDNILLTPKNIEGVYEHEDQKVKSYLINKQSLDGVSSSNTLKSINYTIKLPTL